MNKHTSIVVAVASLLLSGIAGCAHGPLQTNEVDVQQSPTQVLNQQRKLSTSDQSQTDSSPAVSDSGTVLWGGVVLSSENLQDGTQIEVLSYPLDYLQRPLQSASATGRFVALYPDYLETIDYAPGRLVTVTGSLEGVETGKVGNADYSYIKVAAEQIHLWSKSGEDHVPAFTFGIGISISN